MPALLETCSGSTSHKEDKLKYHHVLILLDLSLGLLYFVCIDKAGVVFFIFNNFLYNLFNCLTNEFPCLFRNALRLPAILC